jgi:hypothetical protein
MKEFTYKFTLPDITLKVTEEKSHWKAYSLNMGNTYIGCMGYDFYNKTADLSLYLPFTTSYEVNLEKPEDIINEIYIFMENKLTYFKDEGIISKKIKK